MKRFSRVLAFVVATSLAAASATTAHEIKSGDLLITSMWTRATPGGAKVAGGYFTITNNGSVADKLVSATSPASGRVEVHEMSMTNGVMTMRPLDAGLAIDAGKTVTLAPGGFHMMLTDLKQPLKEGELLPITLQFEKAGKVEVTLHIRGVGAQGPGGEAKKGDGKKGDDMGHDHSKMKM